jgi:hypothetical protein
MLVVKKSAAARKYMRYVSHLDVSHDFLGPMVQRNDDDP